MTSPARSAGRSARSAAPRVLPATRPFLRLVPQVRTTAGRAPFAAVIVGLLAVGLLGLLALNAVLAEGAFRLHALEQQARDLATREQVLQRQVEVLRAPGSLDQRARALGMVDGGPPAHLRLSDGAVLGIPAAGVAPVAAAPKPVTPATGKPSTTPTAKPSPGPAKGSTTWTAPRRSPAPRSTGTTR